MRARPGLPPAPPPLSLNMMTHDVEGRDEHGSEPPREDGRLPFGFSGVQGPRSSMEDRLILGASVAKGCHMWGVLDGHGGRRSADYLAEQLPVTLRRVFSGF